MTSLLTAADYRHLAKPQPEPARYSSSFRLAAESSAREHRGDAMRKQFWIALYGLLFIGLSLPAWTLAQADDDPPILKNLKTVTTVASTVAMNGDVNPYGIVRVERSVGKLEAGHILVSNFNNI